MNLQHKPIQSKLLNIRFIDTHTALKMCQVSKMWRNMTSSCYIWRKIAYRAKIVGFTHACADSNKFCTENNLRPLCNCSIQVRKKIRWRKNYVHGKYRKRFLPSLHTNIFEETEKFSSCFDMDSSRIVFGSQQGSLVIWQPSPNKSDNVFIKYKVCNHQLEKVHIHQNRILVIESGYIKIFW